MAERKRDGEVDRRVVQLVLELVRLERFRQSITGIVHQDRNGLPLIPEPVENATDAVVVVVSEERGEVALCSNGRMVPALDETRLTRQLNRLFGLDEEASGERSGQPNALERRAS